MTSHLLHGAVWHGDIWHGAVCHGAVWHGDIWHGAVWHPDMKRERKKKKRERLIDIEAMRCVPSLGWCEELLRQTYQVWGNVQTYLVSGNVKTYQMSGNVKTYQVSGNVKTYQVSGNVKTYQVPGKCQYVPSVRKCQDVPSVRKCQDTYQVSGNVKNAAWVATMSWVWKNWSKRLVWSSVPSLIWPAQRFGPRKRNKSEFSVNNAVSGGACTKSPRGQTTPWTVWRTKVEEI